MAGVVGFEPTQWRDQNPLPYHLATPQSDKCQYIIAFTYNQVKYIDFTILYEITNLN